MGCFPLFFFLSHFSPTVLCSTRLPLWKFCNFDFIYSRRVNNPRDGWKLFTKFFSKSGYGGILNWNAEFKYFLSVQKYVYEKNLILKLLRFLVFHTSYLLIISTHGNGSMTFVCLYKTKYIFLMNHIWNHCWLDNTSTNVLLSYVLKLPFFFFSSFLDATF